jgi:hypothetical protein
MMSPISRMGTSVKDGWRESSRRRRSQEAGALVKHALLDDLVMHAEGGAVAHGGWGNAWEEYTDSRGLRDLLRLNGKRRNKDAPTYDGDERSPVHH